MFRRKFRALPTVAILMAGVLVACTSNEVGSRAAVTPSLGEASASFDVDGGRMGEHVAALAETIGARPSGSEAADDAVAYIQAELAGYGYEPSVQDLPGDVTNVVTSTRGTMACTTLIGAHYDSVPASPGANDNASGVALVLEIARVLAMGSVPGHCFAFFGGEEIGLEGSQGYVALQRPVLALSGRRLRDVLPAMLNFDNVGGPPNIVVQGDPQLISKVESIADELDLAVNQFVPPPGTPNRSDHVSFANEGVPVLWFTTQPYTVLHTANDTVELIDEETMADVATLTLTLLEAIVGDAVGTRGADDP